MDVWRLLTTMFLTLLAWASLTHAADPTWPKELTFALLSTESAPEVTRRWEPILAQLAKDLGVKVKHVAASDYRGTIEALKFKKAEIGHLGPKAYVEATNDNYANVESVVQIRHANGALGYRSCLIVHTDSDIFSPEDIGGKTFAFNDPNSTSGYLVPMTMFLNEMGVNPKQHFSKLTFSGSHEASILAVTNSGGRLDKPPRRAATDQGRQSTTGCFTRHLGLQTDPQRSHRGAEGPARQPASGHSGVSGHHEGKTP